MNSCPQLHHYPTKRVVTNDRTCLLATITTKGDADEGTTALWEMCPEIRFAKMSSCAFLVSLVVCEAVILFSLGMIIVYGSQDFQILSQMINPRQ